MHVRTRHVYRYTHASVHQCTLACTYACVHVRMRASVHACLRLKGRLRMVPGTVCGNKGKKKKRWGRAVATAGAPSSLRACHACIHVRRAMRALRACMRCVSVCPACVRALRACVRAMCGHAVCACMSCVMYVPWRRTGSRRAVGGLASSGHNTKEVLVRQCCRLRLGNCLLDPLSPHLFIFVMTLFRHNVFMSLYALTRGGLR